MAATRRFPNRARPVKPSDPAAVDKLRRDLVTVTKRRARTREADDRAVAERDRVIADAHAGGVPPSEIAAITGLTRGRVDQLRVKVD